MNEETLARLARLVSTGHTDDARGLLAALDSRDLRGSPEVHLRLARLAEELGEVARAVLEYNLALRDDLAQPEVVLALARLRIDQGELQRAERALRHLLALDPDHAEGRRELAALLALHGQEAPGEAAWRDRGPEAPHVAAPDAGDAVCLADLFSGREGVYARQWRSTSGETGYSPIQAPFTHDVARRHLSGAETVGIYPVRADDTVIFAAFDLDIPRGLLARCASGRSGPRREGLERLLAGVRSAALQLRDAARRLGVEGLLEDSGWKGYHVWFFFRHPVPAAAARRLLHGIVDEAGAPPRGVQVEVFPKQARVEPGSLGNLIKLPLGVHRVTGRRCPMVDDDGRPIDGIAALHQAPRIGREQLRDLLARPKAGGSTSDERPDDEASSMPERAPFRLELDREWLWLRSRCEVVGEISRRAESSGVLSGEERAVLTYTAGHLRDGASVVNAVLGRTLGEAVPRLKSPLRGHPMSCPKIRSRVPQIAASVRCDCRFQPLLHTYPHPLLHLATLRAPAGDALGQLQAEQLVSDLASSRRDLARLLASEADLAARLDAAMDAAGVEALVTRAGTVRRGVGGTLVIELGAAGGADGGLRGGAGDLGEPAPGAAADHQGSGGAGAGEAR